MEKGRKGKKGRLGRKDIKKGIVNTDNPFFIQYNPLLKLKKRGVIMTKAF